MEQQIALVRRNYHVDSGRIYVGGNSDGGRGALYFALRQPTVAAATFHLASFPSLATLDVRPEESLLNTPAMFVLSGEEDALFPEERVGPLWAALRAGGADVRRTVVPGAGHDVARIGDHFRRLLDQVALVSRAARSQRESARALQAHEASDDWAVASRCDTGAQAPVRRCMATMPDADAAGVAVAAHRRFISSIGHHVGTPNDLDQSSGSGEHRSMAAIRPRPRVEQQMRPLPFAAVIAFLIGAAPLRAQHAPTQASGTLPSIALPAALDRVLRDYERAWRAGDVPALVALFTADGFVLQPGRPPARGHAELSKRYQGEGGGPLRLRALAYAAADTVGYIVGAYGYGDDPDDMGKFTLTLRRGRDGRWLIASDMDNGSRPSAPPSAPH